MTQAYLQVLSYADFGTPDQKVDVTTIQKENVAMMQANYPAVTTYNYGWYCQNCLCYHFGTCPKMPIVLIQPVTAPYPYPHGETPHCCPVCGGRGVVTFNPDNPYSPTTVTGAAWNCKACSGGGVLWR